MYNHWQPQSENLFSDFAVSPRSKSRAPTLLMAGLPHTLFPLGVVTVEAIRGPWRQWDYDCHTHRLAQRQHRSPALFVGVGKEPAQISAPPSTVVAPGTATLTCRTRRSV